MRYRDNSVFLNITQSLEKLRLAGATVDHQPGELPLFRRIYLGGNGRLGILVQIIPSLHSVHETAGRPRGAELEFLFRQL